MNQVILLSTLLSVLALASSALVGDNRYGSSHSGNSLGYRGGPSRYSSGSQHSRSAGHPGSLHQSYGAPRGHSQGNNYGSHQSARQSVHQSSHQSAPSPYAGARHLGAPSGGLSHYGGPAPYAGPVPFGGQAHASIPNHYSSPKRSVYQQPAHSSAPRSNYGQPQTYSHSHQSAESRSQTSGREMKYTVRDPQNKGTTHVTETHVTSNRQMHGAEAEAAMKKLMGSMGPGSDNGFQDFVKGMGLPFY